MAEKRYDNTDKANPILASHLTSNLLKCTLFKGGSKPVNATILLIIALSSHFISCILSCYNSIISMAVSVDGYLTSLSTDKCP